MVRSESFQRADPRLVRALQGARARVEVRALDRLVGAHDASHCVLTPEAIAVAADASEVAGLFAASRASAFPVTFRSGGTSLSGQAGTSGVLIDTRRQFRHIEVLDDGVRVRVQSGAGGARREPASATARTQAWARSRVGDSLHDRRGGREQLQRDVARHACQHLPDPRFPGPGAARRDGDRHGRTRRRSPATRPRARHPRASGAAPRPGAFEPGLGGHTSPVACDQDHHELRAQLVPTPRRPGEDPRASDRRFRVHARLRGRGDLADDSRAAGRGHEAVAVRGHRGRDRVTARPDRGWIRDLDVRDRAALLVELQEPDDRTLTRRRAEAERMSKRLPLRSPMLLTTDPTARAHLWKIRKGLFTAVARRARPRCSRTSPSRWTASMRPARH